MISLYETKNEQTSEERQIEKERKLHLHQVISNLKQHYRDVVILRGIEELSIKETASVLNWSESKVKVTFHRALKALKPKVKEAYHEEK